MNITTKVPITAETAGIHIRHHDHDDNGSTCVQVDAPAVIFGPYDPTKPAKGQGIVLYGKAGSSKNRFGPEMLSWAPRKRLHDTNLNIPDEQLNMHDFHERGRLLGASDLAIIEKFISEHPRFTILPSIYYHAASTGDVAKMEALANVVGTFTEDPDKVVFGDGYSYFFVKEITPFTYFGAITMGELLRDVWKWAALSGSVAMMECMDRLFHDYKPTLLDIVGAHTEFFKGFSATTLNWLFPDISKAIEEERAVSRQSYWGDNFKHEYEAQDMIIPRHALQGFRASVVALNKPMAKWLADAFPILKGQAQLFLDILMYDNGGIPQLEILDEILDREPEFAIALQPLFQVLHGHGYNLIALENLKWLNEHRPGKIVIAIKDWRGLHLKDMPHDTIEMYKRLQPQTYAYLVEQDLVRQKRPD